MKVAITGAAGVLGGRLVEALESAHELTLCDLPNAPRFGSDHRRWVACDVTEPEQVHEALAGQNAVVHTVALVRGRGEQPLERFIDVMVKGTWIVADAAARAGVRRFINISSVNAAGSPGPLHEPAGVGDVFPFTPPAVNYGLAKRLAEEVVSTLGAIHPHMATLTLRPGVFDGPNPPDPTRAAAGAHWFRHVHIDDVVGAIRHALEVSVPAHGTFALVAPRPDAMFDWQATADGFGFVPSQRWDDL